MNIADRLAESARKYPHQRAVVKPAGRDWIGRYTYSHLTFAQLHHEANRLADGMRKLGVGPGKKIVLMVPPGLEFIALTFAIFRTGAIVVLIDPGMGRTNILNCLREVEPDGFAAIPLVHMIRRLKSRHFPKAIFNLVVGSERFSGAYSYESIRALGNEDYATPQTSPRDPAAIIFTSGSTGTPKGVLYEHGMFNAQVDLLRDHYQIQPGEIDLPGFPLFALFNSAMGVTTVIPDMNPTKPAKVDPRKILRIAQDQGITQAFGSPAFWNRIGRYCQEKGIKIPTLKRALSAGAAVPLDVLRRMNEALPEAASLHTPYGATEALPICSIPHQDILKRTQQQTSNGAGTCVGKPFPHVHVKIIEITDGPIASINEVRECHPGEIGEIIVQSPSVTREYYQKPDATRLAKIQDGDSFWHRMGDVGYLSDDGNLWFCGRKAHIVKTTSGPMYSICVESPFLEHSRVYRAALVGMGAEGRQKPIIIIEPEAKQFPHSAKEQAAFAAELRSLAREKELTASIDTFLFHRSFPVDRRHNVKIHREELQVWAEKELTRRVKT
ncbi:AMP-binding protein [Lacunimicrobium album]